MSEKQPQFTAEEINQFKEYEAYLDEMARAENATSMLPLVGGASGTALGAAIGLKEELPKALKGAVKGAIKGAGKAFASGAAEVMPSSMTSGDKWAKAIGGPGGVDQDAAVQNRAMQKGLTPKEAAEFKVAREGIIIPKKVEEDLAKEAAKEAAKKTNSLSGKVGKIFETVNSPIGRVANKTLGLGSAGFEVGDAVDRVNKGQYGRAAISGLGALGSAATLMPNPLVKVGGAAAGMVAPGLNILLDKLAKENPELFEKLRMAAGGPVQQQISPEQIAQLRAMLLNMK